MLGVYGKTDGHKWAASSAKVPSNIRKMRRIFKGSIFLKNRHFFIQESFNNLIYSIKTIIKLGN